MTLTSKFDEFQSKQYSELLQKLFTSNEGKEFILDCLNNPLLRKKLADDSQIFPLVCYGAFHSDDQTGNAIFNEILSDPILFQHENACWWKIIKDSNNSSRMKELINSTHFFNYESAGYVVRKPQDGNVNEAGKTLFRAEPNEEGIRSTINFIIDHMKALSNLTSDITIPPIIYDRIAMTISNIPVGLIYGFGPGTHPQWINKYHAPFEGYDGELMLECLLQLDEHSIVESLMRASNESYRIFYKRISGSDNVWSRYNEGSVNTFLGAVAGFSAENKLKLVSIFKQFDRELNTTRFDQLAQVIVSENNEATHSL